MDTSATDSVTPAQAQQELPDWTVVDGRLELSVRAKDYLQAIEFINRFSNIAQAHDHHSDFDLRYNTVRMRVVSHDVGHLTQRDIRFAVATDVIIDEMQLVRQPKKISRQHLVIASRHIPVIKPFWAAVLHAQDKELDGTQVLVDRSDVLPPVHFWQLPDTPVPADDEDTSHTAAGNIHLNIFVPAQLVQERVKAAVEAGGKLLNTMNDPKTWELCDLDGNRVIVHSH